MIQEKFFLLMIHTKFVKDFGVLDQELWYSFCKYWNFGTDFDFNTLLGAYIILS